MKEVKVLELDKYEEGLIIKALTEFRNNLMETEQKDDVYFTEELLLKILNSPQKKRMFPKKYAEER